ncbi:hypothetical protein IKQ26_07570 [bacterium]|nr:hypothetical protein [bacterium]
MRIDTNFNRNMMFSPFTAHKNVSSAPVTKSSETSVFVSDGVDSAFAENVISQYASLAKNHDTLSNVIILSSPDVKQVEEIKELDDKTKATIKKYLSGAAQDAYGFYSRKSDSVVLIQSNHERKDTKYEGEIAEQGADTMLHEFAHLLDKNISMSEGFITAYYQDLKDIEKHLKENPDDVIPGSDMTYKDAMVYFDHYYEGADFSDGIDEADITRTGLRENFAESYATVYDNQKSKVNDIYSSLFPHTTDFVREFVA